MSRRAGGVRSAILRPLAGPVAASVLALAFALDAVGGVEIAERWLALWFGDPSGRPRED